MAFWDPDRERMDREAIEQLQLERLQSTLNRVYKNVRHFRKTFQEMDFFPEDLRTLSDLTRLPLLTRADLMRNYPYDMFAVPLREVVRLHTPVLNQDDPVVMGFTQNDLKNWAALMARSLTAVGLDSDDVVQVAPTFGIMTGAFGVQLGAGRIGASVIPIPGSSFPAHVKILRDFRTTALVATPTFVSGVLQSLQSLGIDVNTLSLKWAILGSEPWGEATRTELEGALHVTATDIYTLAEVFGPGVAWECPEKDGLHIPEDHFIPEIVDPDSGAPLPPGEEGELVVTTIAKEAFPLIRFRTGDVTRLTYAPCACGRTHARIGRVVRRCDDAVVMRGNRIVPDQIARVLAELVETVPPFQLLIDRVDGQDRLTVQIEISDNMFFDEMRRQRRFVESLHRNISESLGWEAAVRLVEPGTFDPDRKARDRRRFD
jgi:phenylacetate-CoA ligase